MVRVLVKLDLQHTVPILERDREIAQELRLGITAVSLVVVNPEEVRRPTVTKGTATDKPLLTDSSSGK